LGGRDQDSFGGIAFRGEPGGQVNVPDHGNRLPGYAFVPGKVIPTAQVVVAEFHKRRENFRLFGGHVVDYGVEYIPARVYRGKQR
jgi:hypothetical protein